jgi:RimJ/RimL family protein N-acetyltransferase
MPYAFTPLRDASIASFVLGLDEAEELQRVLERSLAAGSTRPEWCWTAWDPAGHAAARHTWWGRPGLPYPIGLDLRSAEDHDAAVALVVYARGQLGVLEARSEITVPTHRGDSPSAIRAPLVAVLRGAGFGFQVARVTVEWTSSSPPGPDRHRLSFRPARDLDDDLLLALFVAVGADSLDHGMIVDRARLGADGEARRRLGAVRSYGGEPAWFSVGFTARGEPVGYVVPGLAGGVPIVAEIGVATAHRGQRYVDDLLAWATDILRTSGAERIVADTDRANSPMRAAFRRADYREVRWRDDYAWRQAQDPKGLTQSS